MRHVSTLRGLRGERRSLRDDRARDHSPHDNDRRHDIEHARHDDDPQAQPLDDHRGEVNADDDVGDATDDADHCAHGHTDDRQARHADDGLHSPDDRTGHDHDRVRVDTVRARDVLLGLR